MNQKHLDQFFTSQPIESLKSNVVIYNKDKYHLVESDSVMPRGLHQRSIALVNREFKHLAGLRKVLKEVIIENHQIKIPDSLTNLEFLTKSQGTKIRSSQSTVLLWEEGDSRYIIKIRDPFFVELREKVGERANLGFVDEANFIENILRDYDPQKIKFPQIFFASEDVLVQEFIEGVEPPTFTSEEEAEILRLDSWINENGKNKGVASDMGKPVNIPGVPRITVNRNFILSNGELYCIDPLKLYI